MEKNTYLSDSGNINLFQLFKIVWDRKIKIILITIISFLIGLGYSYQLPKNYLITLSLDESNDIGIVKINSLNRFFEKNNNKEQKRGDYTITKELILEKFILELQDYEEFLIHLKNSKKIKNNFINSSPKKNFNLYQYTNLLNIEPPKKREKTYTLTFKWHDASEARQILQNTLELVATNLKNSIFRDLNELLNIEKKIILSNDSERIIYLTEQSSIAKDLGIENNQIDRVNLAQSSSISLNVNTADIAYYLRGYKAIDKEIELIKQRKYSKFSTIEQEINSIKATNIKWVVYNDNLFFVKSVNKTKIILIISILLGLIVGILYALISNELASKIVLKKN